VRQQGGLGLTVAVGEPDEDDEPLGDLADDFALYLHARPSDPLHDRSHGFPVSFPSLG
jgi:hypothetical protein